MCPGHYSSGVVGQRLPGLELGGTPSVNQCGVGILPDYPQHREPGLSGRFDRPNQAVVDQGRQRVEGEQGGGVARLAHVFDLLE